MYEKFRSSLRVLFEDKAIEGLGLKSVASALNTEHQADPRS